MTRLQICDELAAAGCTLVGAEWSIDQLVEKAFLMWQKRGSPRYAVVIIERDRETGEEIILIEAPDAPIELE